VLVRRQPESALMDFRNLAESSLEVLPRFILHSPVLDKASEVILALTVLHPAKFVDVAGEVERASGLESETLTSLHLGFECVQSHAVDGVLEPSVLAAGRIECKFICVRNSYSAYSDRFPLSL